MSISIKTNIRSLIIKTFAVALIISGYTNEIYLLGFVGFLLSTFEVWLSKRSLSMVLLEVNAEHCASLVVFVLSSVMTNGFLPEIKHYAMAAFIAALLLPISVVNFLLKEGGEL